MPELTIHAPGTPIWVDLGSPDLEASKAFYSSLFGWEGHTEPAPEAGGYTMFHLRGKGVAGAAPLMSPQQPPAWTTYVSVEDADKTAQRVRDAGGTILMEPMDVLDAGRMAILQDPGGAVVGVWQPRNHRGAEVFNEPGALCWNELDTRDTEAAKAFYGKVFGWGAKSYGAGPTGYTEWQLGEKSVAGMMEMGEAFPAGVPPHWLVYFAVADCEAAAERAKGLGAKVLMPPREIEPGTFAVLSDPQGAAFAIIQMKQ